MAEERCGNIDGNGEGAMNMAGKGSRFCYIRGDHEEGFRSINSSNISSSFECNICLESAMDPVVTLCGHLFCWPCIYRWLCVSCACPVCKAPAKEAALIPLYGGGSTKPEPRNVKTPNRPTPVLHAANPGAGYMSHQSYSYPYPSSFTQYGFDTGINRAGYELFPFFAFQGGSVVQSLPRNRYHEVFIDKLFVFLSCFVFVCLLSF